jgi:hypothetical protein
MAKPKLKIGEMVKVIKYRPGKYAPGVKDELGTEKLFKSMVGKSYEIKGIDRYGHVELRPTRLDSVLIEPELVELAATLKKSAHKTARSRRRG